MIELRYRNYRLLVFSIIFFFISLIWITGGIVFLIDGDSGLAIGLLPFGIIFLIIAIVTGYKSLHLDIKRRRSIKSGQCFEAEIIDMQYDYAVRTARILNISRYPLRITAKYTDDRGTSHIVESGHIYKRLKTTPHQYSAKVWVKPANTKDSYLQVFTNE